MAGFTLRFAMMKFLLDKGGRLVHAALTYDDRPGIGWEWRISGNDGASGFGWKLKFDAPAGSDLAARFEAVVLHNMPAAVLADALDDANPGRYGVVASWLRNPDLKPTELLYS